MSLTSELSVALQRLSQQRIARDPFEAPDEVVAWLGAVQAQDYPGAQWALGLRIRRATADVIDRAFAAGSILRTHVMRPTWHLVAPADIRWLLELTAPRVHALNAPIYRRLGLDDATLARGGDLIARALEGRRHLTRAELGLALSAGGIVADGLRLTYIVMHAELDAVICSGPRRGNQFTYALLAERAPAARSLPRDEALAELAERYFTGHGPATIRDFAWWSGLTAADARAGLATVGARLAHEVIDGQTYWFPSSMPPADEAARAAFLLPTYDEFLVGFAGFDRARRGGRVDAKPLALNPMTIVLGGRVVGSWKRTFQKGSVLIQLAPFAPLTAEERDAIASAGRRYGEFVASPVVLA